MLRHIAVGIAVILTLCAPAVAAAAMDPPAPAGRVTILYDAFGDRPGLERDWGFSALIEYGGRRILFDTGNNGEVFARNVHRRTEHRCVHSIRTTRAGSPISSASTRR